MRKIVLAFMAVIFMAGAAAAEFSLGLRYGGSPEETNFGRSGSEKDFDSAVYGVDFMFGSNELFNNLITMDENMTFGIKIGFSKFGEYSFTSINDVTLKSNIYSVSEAVYFKYQFLEMLSANFNLGLHTAFNINDWENPTGSDSNEVNFRAIPTVGIGVEFRPLKFLAIGLDASYLMSGKFKSGKYYYGTILSREYMYRDISGFNYNATVRFYFS